MRLFRAASALAAAAMAAALVTAPSAAADCVSSSGTTVCSQGEARGANTGMGPGTMTGPAYPYSCGYSWYCDDYGVDIVFGGGFWR
jgi:hypothetical protein